MLRRKIESRLLDWKKSHGRKCLLVKGARQVGKTFSIEKFGKEQYENLVVINFIEEPACQSIFSGSLDADTLTMQISLRMRGAQLVPGKTLLFLDEIQMCPNARTALKFLAEDSRYDVIASGSMLGIQYKDVSSFPVGYVDYLDMNSLDFEEFLWAVKVPEETDLYLFLKQCMKR